MVFAQNSSIFHWAVRQPITFFQVWSHTRRFEPLTEELWLPLWCHFFFMVRIPGLFCAERAKRLSYGCLLGGESIWAKFLQCWLQQTGSCNCPFCTWLGLPLSGLSVPFYTAPSSVTPVGSLASPAESAGFSVALVAAPPQLPPMWLLRLARFLQASLIWLVSASSFQHAHWWPEKKAIGLSLTILVPIPTSRKYIKCVSNLFRVKLYSLVVTVVESSHPTRRMKGSR